MIQDKTPVTLAEVRELLESSDHENIENTKPMLDFIKKFTKKNAEDARKLKIELIKVGIVKLKKEDIVKIIDFMPEDAEDLRKIFSGSEINLAQDEINKILEVLKKKK